MDSPSGDRCFSVFPGFWISMVVMLVANRLKMMHIVEPVLKRRASGMRKEIVMAKAKKRVAARKRSSKRGKADDKPVRKLAAKQGTLRRAKSKVKRAAVSANKPAAKKKRPTKPAKATLVAAMPIETTPMDVIEEPAPGVIGVTEHESVQTRSISTDV